MSSTQDPMEQTIANMFAKHVLPLFDQLLLGQHEIKTELQDFKSQQMAFNDHQTMINNQQMAFNDRQTIINNRQMTTNDHVVKHLENLEIEYKAICHQLEEYDNFFHDSSIPEEKKKSAYKVLVIKVSNLESKLQIVKQHLQMA